MPPTPSPAYSHGAWQGPGRHRGSIQRHELLRDSRCFKWGHGWGKAIETAHVTFLQGANNSLNRCPSEVGSSGVVPVSTGFMMPTVPPVCCRAIPKAAVTTVFPTFVSVPAMKTPFGRCSGWSGMSLPDPVVHIVHLTGDIPSRGQAVDEISDIIERGGASQYVGVTLVRTGKRVSGQG